MTCSVPRGERGDTRLVVGVRSWVCGVLQPNTPPRALWSVALHASHAERQKHLVWFCLNEQISIVRVIALHSVMHLLFNLRLAITQPAVSWAEKKLGTA